MRSRSADTRSPSTTAPPSASPPTFAILSLVGDQFDLVTKREEIGSRIDPNSHRNIPFDSAALDDIALAAAESVIKRLKPVSPVVRFSIRDPRLFALQDKLLVDSGESRDMRGALAKLLREHQATRLVLVTKWRDDAEFKMRIPGRPVPARSVASGSMSIPISACGCWAAARRPTAFSPPLPT